MTSPRISATVERVMRDDWGRLLAVLISDLKDFQLAEDCLSEAFARALDHWPRGIPNNPQGWLLQTARRRAIDRIRRTRTFDRKLPDLTYLMELDAMDRPEPDDIPDERLRLIFTACHPALDQKTRLALTLRTLCGLTTAEIARAFLDREATMAQRLARARAKISKAGIPYAIPGPADWDERLNSVLTVIYLIFNEGYAASSGAAQIRRDLCDEAIRLARAINELRPNVPETMGLLALMLLNHARSPARVDDHGNLIPLSEQRRDNWHADMIEEGLMLIDTALRRGRVGPFQLQAAISAIHAEAPSAADTNWAEIVLIYDRLIELIDNPVVALNRAVAVSFALGPKQGLSALPENLEHYQSFHAAHADMLWRVARFDDAISAFEKAISLSNTDAERAFLKRRQADVVQTKKEAEQSSAQVQQGG